MCVCVFDFDFADHQLWSIFVHRQSIGWTLNVAAAAEQNWWDRPENKLQKKLEFSNSITWNLDSRKNEMKKNRNKYVYLKHTHILILNGES